jgi:predicted RNase H-like HicB family nuclease
MKVTYRVTARRAGDWWALEVPELPGVFSQTKRLDQADAEAREAIAVMLDVEPDEVRVSVEPVLTADMQRVLRKVARARKDAQKASEEERRALQEAAALLTKNLSQRDAGRVMGLSFQRVSQLLRGVVPAARPTARPASRSARERAAS